MDAVRVLIADDNLLFARSLEAILADDERFDVVGCAQNGEEAEEAVELAEDGR